jgi:hypothetical protein
MALQFPGLVGFALSWMTISPGTVTSLVSADAAAALT